MLPEQVLSSETIAAQFAYPRNIPKRPLIDYEYGGVALNDSSEGIRARVWKGEYLEGQVILSTDGVTPTPVLTLAGISDFQFTFDRNMNVFVCYEFEDGSDPQFYWFDTILGDYTTTTLPAGCITPRCAHDDTRDLQTSSSDIILAYCRDGSLYFRAQRERYADEHLLTEEAGPGGLIQIGMNRVWRFQFQLSTASV